MNTIIVDDESKSRSLLRNLLQDHCKGIESIEEAPDIKTAVKWINNHPVDLVFLDIEMPNENGFALFDYFQNPSFTTIFCTAYSEYAIQAFEVSAVAYLLKPVSIIKLQEAVEKAFKQRTQQLVENTIPILKDNLQHGMLQKIAIPLADGLTFISLENVFYFEADGSYTHVFTRNGNYLVSKKIKEFNDLLENDPRFFRVHRSYLVNTNVILKYSKKEGASLLLENQKTIPVAREKKAELEDFIQKMSL